MAFKFCSFSGWNCWFSSVGIDIVNKLIAVISFVGQYLTPFYVYLAQHWKGEGNIVFLPFADHQVNRITVRIDYGMDFFVLAPPRLCPILFGGPFFCGSAVRMCLDNGTIQRKFITFSLKAQNAKDIIKEAIVVPFAETAVNCFPRAISFRKIPPRCSTMGNLDNTIQDYTITFSWTALFTRILGRK